MFSNPKPKSRNVKHKICIKILFIFHYKSWDILTLSITPSIHLRCTIVAYIQNMQKFIVRRLFIAGYSCRTVALHSKKKKFKMGDHSNFFGLKSYSYATIQCIIKISPVISTIYSNKHDKRIRRPSDLTSLILFLPCSPAVVS